MSARVLAARWRALHGELRVLLADCPPTRSIGPTRIFGVVTGRDIQIVVTPCAAEHLGQAELTRDLLPAMKETACVSLWFNVNTMTIILPCARPL